MAINGTESDRLLLCLLGPLEARVQGRPLSRLRTRKGEWLLALLVLRSAFADGPPRPVDRGWLAGALWPDSPEPLALRSLRTALADLRRALGPEADRIVAPTPRTLALDLMGAEVDLLSFDAAIARGDLPALEEAVALYRAPLLEGCVEPWAVQEREAREQACLGALETVASDALANGRPSAAEGYLRRAIAMDPLRESAYRALMDAQAAAGNRAAVVGTYRDLRLLLHRELNATPDPETTTTYEALRADQRPTTNDQRPTADDAPSSHRRLPVYRTPLLGREAELAALRALCLIEDVGLLTLTGPGGTGKTRLAARLAADMEAHFEDGVAFVDLAPIRDPRLVVPAIAQSLGVRESAGQPLSESVAAYLRPRQLLLLLDNFEHLLAAALSVADLLSAAPRLTVLATSRSALRLREEREYVVPPLTECPSVQLFVERARRVRPEFALTEGNGDALAEICRRLDGLPLAIELAAARVRLLPPQALLSRLERRLELLVGGARNAPARQQTLRNTIAWSYDLLGEREQALFRQLSVFVGGCTLEAVETVCGGSLDLIEPLVELHLVRSSEDADGGPRFVLLETIREFGQERLAESGEAAWVRERHARYYLELVRQAEPALRGAARLLWLRRLDREQANFQAALAWSDANPNSSDLGMEIAGSLTYYWAWLGQEREPRRCIESALARSSPAEPTPARAKALFGRAFFHWGHRDLTIARTALEEAIAIWRELGDKRNLAHLLGELALFFSDNLDRASRSQRSTHEMAARSLLEERLALCREIGDRWGEAASLGIRGTLARSRNSLDEAEALLRQGMAIAEEIGAGELASAGLRILTLIAFDRADYDAALALAEEALPPSRQWGAKIEVAFALRNLGRALHLHGEHRRARALYEESVAIHRELDFKVAAADVLREAAEVARTLGDDAAHRALLDEAAALRRAIAAPEETSPREGATETPDRCTSSSGCSLPPRRRGRTR